MGIICDLIIAKDADAIATSANIWTDFTVLQTKVLDVLKLEALFSLVDPDSPLASSWSQTAVVEYDEVVIFQLPPVFVERLARMTERESIATAWVTAGEFDYFESNSEPFVVSLLDDVCGIAEQAVEQGKSLFLFMSP